MVQSMLKALGQRHVSLEKCLAKAEEQTVDRDHLNIVTILQRAYWPKRKVVLIPYE